MMTCLFSARKAPDWQKTLLSICQDAKRSTVSQIVGPRPLPFPPFSPPREMFRIYSDNISSSLSSSLSSAIFADQYWHSMIPSFRFHHINYRSNHGLAFEILPTHSQVDTHLSRGNNSVSCVILVTVEISNYPQTKRQRTSVRIEIVD